MILVQANRKFWILAVCGFLIFGDLGAQKLLESIKTYYYHSDTDSVNGVKIANEYTGTSRIASHSIYLWTGRWDGWSFPCEECSLNPGRYEYGYDEKGNQVSSGGFEWWGHSVGWVQRSRTENRYDEYGNKVSSLSESWNTEENEWFPSSNWEYGYDHAGRMISSIINLWFLTLKAWHPMEKKLLTFEGNGRKTQEITQQWPDSSGDWVNQNKTDWYYDTAGIKTEIASSTWVLINNNYDWKEDNRHKIENVFDSAGNRILTTDFVKSSPTHWTATYKEELKYNEIGKPVLSVISKGTSGLTEYLRTEWIYNLANQLTMENQTGWLVRREGPLPIKDRLKVNRSFDSEGDISKEIWYYWDGESKSYLPDGKDYFFYQSTSSGKKEIQIDPISIYPNPTHGIISISGLLKPAEVKFYSIQGILLRTIHNVDVSVDISDLPSGAYLILVGEASHIPFRTIFIKE